MVTLFDFQKPAADALEAALRRFRVAVDASDTGVGKTYVAAVVAARLNDGPVVVICPKAVVPIWKDVLEKAGVETYAVTNYENLKTGTTGLGTRLSQLPGFPAAFIQEYANFPIPMAKTWRWDASLPRNTLFIWDEAHRAQGQDSQNARVMASSKLYRNLIISATLAESPVQMRAVGYLLGMHGWRDWFQWCLRNNCVRLPFGSLYFRKQGSTSVLTRIHDYIFGGGRGVRIRIKDLGDAFPDNQITAEAYDLEADREINLAYAEAEKELVEALMTLTASELSANVLAIRMKTRQIVERLKAPAIAKMAEDLVAEGNHVVIFTNFTATLEYFQERLKTNCLIYGTSSTGRPQTVDERSENIRAFQADESPYTVANIEAGGVGISLHDLHGQHPRVALVCPTDNAKSLRQALGRIHRAGGKSKTVQRIIFAAGTVEERICNRTQMKLDNLDLLNDGELHFDTYMKKEVAKKQKAK